jgi:hypothetical protein
MNAAKITRKMTHAAVITLAFLNAVLAGAAVFAHGGKSHDSGGKFTNLEALKKATELYDKHVAEGLSISPFFYGCMCRVADYSEWYLFSCSSGRFTRCGGQRS